MRTLLTIAAIGAALALANITLTLRTIDATMQLVLLRTDEIPRQVQLVMTTVTISQTTANGRVVSGTWTQGAYESASAFRSRVQAEWDALWDMFGD